MTPALRQGLLFVMVGGLATVTHLAMALAARELVGLSPLNANFVGYAMAVGVSYVCNARLTFGAPALHAARFGRFLVVSLLGLAANQLIIHVVVQQWRQPFWLGLVVVVALVPGLTFLVSRAWVFRTAS